MNRMRPNILAEEGFTKGEDAVASGEEAGFLLGTEHLL